MSRWAVLEEYAMVPLRIGIAAVFLYTGISKAIDLDAATSMLTNLGFGGAKTFAIILMVFEILGGLLLLLGLLTRYAGIALSVILILAFIIVGLRNIGTGQFLFSLKDIGLLGATLALTFAGARRWSLDEVFLID